jgi:hypothetical protein
MSTQPLEDIYAIASRFQAWVGAQPGAYKDGVRELTYEEAVRSKKPHTKSEKIVPGVSKSTQAAGAKRKNAAQPQKPRRKTPAPRRPRVNQSNKSQETALTAVLKPVTFQQALAEQVTILPAATTAEPRTTALSLRISSAEHALLKRRAAEANISVSCYLRNCVLEVENLRAQLARITADREMASMQVTHRISAFSFCMQVMRRLFFRKSTALVLRV